jgi:excisionase family DNA binding protein
VPEDFNPTEWITTKEAAELTGYHTVHVRRLLREGRVEGKKFGRDWMISRESIQEYKDQMKELGPSKHDPRRKRPRESKADD